MKTSLCALITHELKQKEAICNCLVNKIIRCKLLLIDHVEALESVKQVGLPETVVKFDKLDKCVNLANVVQSCLINVRGLLTIRNTCLLLGMTLVERYITPKRLRLTVLPSLVIAGGVSALFAIKSAFVFRNKIVERELEDLLHSIEAFGNCIRRNITYFNEVLIMKHQDLIESRQIERAWDCITSAKEVIEILFDGTRKLESHYPLPQSYESFYLPMEELRDCEYFKTNVTCYSPKHIKDFYNIFAYVQSQFLLRLALSIMTTPSISQLNTILVKINCLIHQLVQEEENHFKTMSIEESKKEQKETKDLSTTKVMPNRCSPIAVLQDSSLKLSARMVAVAGECQALDIILQKLFETEGRHKDHARQFIEVASYMRSIENSLTMCCDDFQRLILVYNKLLNAELGIPSEKITKHNESNIDDDQNESFLSIEVLKNVNETEDDEFYAYMFDEINLEKETQSAPPVYDEEIDGYEKRITRSKFRPVLKQLKDRIDPIRQEMFEKERKVLESKGINVKELFNEENTYDKKMSQDSIHSSSSDSEDDSADFKYNKHTKLLKKRDNYAEMRNFLAQKEAIKLYRLEDLPQITNTAGEEILE